MAEDPMDALIRMLRRAKALEERLLSVAGMLGWASLEPPEPLEDLEDEIRYGVAKPLFTVEDLGDKIVVVVDLAGAGDDVTVTVNPDSVTVEASIRREAYEAALGYHAWHAAARKYRATIRLPAPVDPSTARYERRKGLLIITVDKAQPAPRA